LADAKSESFTSGFGQGFRKGVDETELRLKESLALQRQMLERDSIPLDYQVNLHDVLSITKGKFFLNGREVEADELSALKGEAISLSNFRLWAIIQETIKQKGIEKAVLESKNWEEVLAGKMMLHDLGLIRSIIQGLSSIGK